MRPGAEVAAYRRRKRTNGSGLTGEPGTEQAGELTPTARAGDVAGKPGVA